MLAAYLVTRGAAVRQKPAAQGLHMVVRAKQMAAARLQTQLGDVVQFLLCKGAERPPQQGHLTCNYDGMFALMSCIYGGLRRSYLEE